MQNDRSPGELLDAVNAGTGPCSLCNCDGFADDGSGFSRCKCGDRKMDHRSQDTDVDAALRELLRADRRTLIPS